MNIATITKDHNVFSLAAMDSFLLAAEKLEDTGEIAQEALNDLSEIFPNFRDFNDLDGMFHSGVKIEVDSVSEMFAGDAEERIHQAKTELSKKLKWEFFELDKPEEAYLNLRTDNGINLVSWIPDFWEPGTKHKRWLLHHKFAFERIYSAGEPQSEEPH